MGAPPSSAELVELWEYAATAEPAQRSLVLLQWAFPGKSPESLATLSVGRRDECLFRLRARAFGSELCCALDCAHCGEPLELQIDMDELQVDAGPDDAPITGVIEEGPLCIEFRLPDSLDLASISKCDSAAGARKILLERCLTSLRHHDGRPVTVNDLSNSVVGRIAEAMDELDPQAHTELDVFCPACRRHCQPVFDIASYFWSELQDFAVRTLRQVHVLAAAYGWREVDILELSPLRRRLYLELAQQ